MTNAKLQVTSAVAVLGAGAMGRGIALVVAAAGHPVLLYDAVPDIAVGAMEKLRADYERLVSRGKLDRDEAHARLARITPVGELDELSGVALVIEAIIEDLQIKRDLLTRIEEIVDVEVILTTNTSSLSITELGGSLKHAERFAGLHFFNPAPLMPLVEIVRGAATSEEVTESLVALTRAWSKTPVVCGSSPGFIVNRVARPFYGEAMRLVEERAAEPATIDALLRDCGGFKMGPFELTDLIGQDVNFSVTRSVYQGFFNDPRYQPSLIQQELVMAGHLGRKNNKGFYTYTEGFAMPRPASESEGRYPRSVEVRGNLGPAAVLVDMAEAAGIRVERREGEGSLHVDGLRMLLTDGMLAAEHTKEAGPTVLFDYALDYREAGRIAVAVPDGLAPAHKAQAVGFFQALGKEISIIDDVAGMVVMRTVAMLINEAIDALHQGIASAADIDLAMMRGVNYPVGLLAWADRLGAHHLLEVMENLARISPDGRYRPSPLLRRRAADSIPFFHLEKIA